MVVGQYGQLLPANLYDFFMARKNNRAKTEVGVREIPSNYYYYIQDIEDDYFWISAGMTKKGLRIKKSTLSYRVPQNQFQQILPDVINKFVRKAAAYALLHNELIYGRDK